jgi:hypothetical protein
LGRYLGTAKKWIHGSAEETRVNSMAVKFRQSLRTLVFSHPINIFVLTIVASALFIVAYGLVLPPATPTTTVSLEIIEWAIIVYVLLFLYGTFFCSVILLLRRKWLAAACYFVAGCIAYVSNQAALALQGNRFAFPGGAHREIAAIYDQRGSELELDNPIPHLVGLDERCHPWGVQSCECWILVDSEDMSGAKQDLGGWHRPKAPILTKKTYFAIVNVRRLDARAFSILSCNDDLRSWLVPY